MRQDNARLPQRLASSGAPDLGAPLGGLNPRGRGRAAEESEEEGGGEGESEARAVQGEAPLAGMDGRVPRVAGLPPGWAPLRRVTVEEDESGPESGEQDGSDAWARVRRECVALGKGRIGSLLYIDQRCKSYGMFGLDPWWVEHFAAFYDSGKMTDVCRKGLRAGGSASACRAVARAALFQRRDLDPGTVGVVPIMSATRDEATDRFVTITAILRALGRAPKRGGDDEGNHILPGGIGGEYESTKSTGGGGLIRTLDSQGHKIEFRVLPALVRHSVGFTGVAGFLDESDLWLDDPDSRVPQDGDEDPVMVDMGGGRQKAYANPAGTIFQRVAERFTTQPEAELLIYSASYKPRSAHSVKVDEGDTAIQYLARLGAHGARLDEEARRELAIAIGSQDPRLLAPGDPMSSDIPAWVTNRGKASILRCYALSGKGSTDSERKIGEMLGKYGGRASENAAVRAMPDVEWAVLGIPHRNADCIADDRFAGYDHR